MLCMQVSCYLPNHLSQARRVPPFIFEGPLCPAKEYFLMLCIFLLFYIVGFSCFYTIDDNFYNNVLFLCDLDCQVV